MKQLLTLLAVVALLGVRPAQAADVISEFTSSNAGWATIGHVRSAGPLPFSGITASNGAPAVANGFLRVQDLNDDWNWVAAPAVFLGDWRRFGSVGLGLVTDDFPTIYPLVLFLSGSVDGVTTNSASYQFTLGNTPASTRLDLSTALVSNQWTMVSGNWSNLMANVQQFWIRMDLNNNVAGELDLLDYVRLVDAADTTLRIYRAVDLEFIAVAGVTNQLQISTDLTAWKNYGLPFVGDGKLQTRAVRIGDQTNVSFRVIRTP